ncbi:MAG: beta-N-acetylhexosaminidase [Hansschlegelia sp.]
MSVRAFICGCEGLELSSRERDFLRETQPWGLILFGRNIASLEQVSTLCASFRQVVGRADAHVLIDQEGGRVQRLGPPLVFDHPAAARYGALYETDPEAAVEAARAGAQLMAAELAAVGITIDCVPVLDLPADDMTDAIGDRAYARTVEGVAALGGAVVSGMLAGGVLPVVKHLPGHGRATVDSHYHLPHVSADRATLEATDFRTFQALANAPLGMTGHILFEAIDPDRPATLSPIVISEIVRGLIGFEGLLISDDLSMKALSGSIGVSASGALAAGCDIALHCNGVMDEMLEVAAAAPLLEGRAAERAAAASAMLIPAGAVDIAALREKRDSLLA